MKLFSFAVVLVVAMSASADCGCLNCNKNLRVVSAPNAPITVVYRGEPCYYPRSLAYSVEVPATTNSGTAYPLRSYGYKVQEVKVQKPAPSQEAVLYKHGFKMEVPQPEEDDYAKHYKYFINLVAKPDRVVMPAPEVYRLPAPCSKGPTIEYLPKCHNGGSYRHIVRQKRRFFRFPERPTAKIKKIGGRQPRIKNDPRLDQKRQKITTDHFDCVPCPFRTKRSFSFQDSLPFYQVFERHRDRRNQVFEDDHRNSLKKDEPYLKPFDVESIFPHDQLFYFVNFPIRALSHFRKLKNHVSPMVESVPKVMSTSTNYLMLLGERFKRGTFNLLGNFLGGFRLWKRPKRNRRKRNLEQSKTIRSNLTFQDPNKEKLNRTNQIERNQNIMELIAINKTFERNLSERTTKDPLRSDEKKNQKQQFLEDPNPNKQTLEDPKHQLPEKLKQQFLRDRRILHKLDKKILQELDQKILQELNQEFPKKLDQKNPPESNQKNQECLKQQFNGSDAKELRSSNLDQESDRKGVKGIKDPMNKRPKRAILKLVDPEDVLEFLKEKLSFFDEVEDVTRSSEETLLTPVTPEDLKRGAKSEEKVENPELVLQKLKLFLDEGKPTFDVKGIKRRLPSRIKKSHKSGHDQYTVKEEINDLIEEAKHISKNSIRKQKEEGQEVPLQTVKNKIKETLQYIQALIQVDFAKNEMIYEELLRMEDLKKVIVKEWRTILEKRKYNDLNVKINLLNKMEELLSKKEDVVETIAECLTEDTKDFNANNLIKILVRLQKLQCILGKSVEEFGETIKYGTPVEVSRELNHLELLDKIDLVEAENHVDLCGELRRQRDDELEAEVELLDNLKSLLESEICEKKADRIDEVAKLLWEINNIAKIQKETLIEMHENIQYGMKIRRELKIIFDLQKHLEGCCAKIKATFKKVIPEDVVQSTTTKPNGLSKLNPLREILKKNKKNLRKTKTIPKR